jgi:hypothetical protein
MPDDSEGPKGSRALTTLSAARCLLAVTLAFGALSFLVHGRGVFARFGRPDAAWIALAAAEFVGAFLFLFRRTVLAWTVVLLIALAWAAGFHFALGLGTANLWLYMTGVLALSAATRAPSLRGPA